LHKHLAYVVDLDHCTTAPEGRYSPGNRALARTGTTSQNDNAHPAHNNLTPSGANPLTSAMNIARHVNPANHPGGSVNGWIPATPGYPETTASAAGEERALSGISRPG
jgi:hypothetical protein